MREYKFRGKRIDNGNWVHGDLIQCSTGKMYIFPSGSYTEVDPSTVGQYTGLKDKNGEEIYEGDIVSNREQERQSSDVGIVRYDTKSGCLVINNNNGRTKRLTVKVIKNNRVKVLGNIHDNPNN